MIEQPPSPIPLHNTMMRRPPHHRLQNPTSIRKRSEWIITRRVDEQVRVARGIGEVVHIVVFMEPGGFEEAFVMVGCYDGEGGAGVEYGEFLDGRGERDHVFVKTGDAGEEGRFGTGWFVGVVGLGVEGFCFPVL